MLTFRSFHSRVRVVSTFAALLLLAAPVLADWGGYVDPTFNCPATTTCPQVCVANGTACPLILQCADNETLCVDGSCAGECADSLESPCPYECAPIACPQIVEYYDQCFVQFGGLYDEATVCGANEVAAATMMVSFNEPAFIFCYTWVSVVTALILFWCFFK